MIRPKTLSLFQSNDIRVRSISKQKFNLKIEQRNSKQNTQKKSQKKKIITIYNNQNLLKFKQNHSQDKNSDKFLNDVKTRKKLVLNQSEKINIKNGKHNMEEKSNLELNANNDLIHQKICRQRVQSLQISPDKFVKKKLTEQDFSRSQNKQDRYLALQNIQQLIDIKNKQKIQKASLLQKVTNINLIKQKKSKFEIVSILKQAVVPIKCQKQLIIQNNVQNPSITHTQSGIQTYHPIFNEQQYQNYIRYIKLQGKTLFSLEEKYKNMKQICKDSDQFYKRNQYVLQNKQKEFNLQDQKQYRVFLLRQDMIRLQKINENKLRQLTQINKVQTQNMKRLCCQIQQNGYKLLNIIDRRKNQNQQQKNTEIVYDSKPYDTKQNGNTEQQSTLYILSYCLQKIKELYKKSEQISSKINRFQKQFQQWKVNINQKDQLTYNMVQQLQKFPQMSIRLFGIQKNSYFRDYIDKKTQQERVAQFRMSKCEKCFQTSKKIDFLHFQNHNIKPILRVLDNMLKRNIQKKSYKMSKS